MSSYGPKNSKGNDKRIARTLKKNSNSLVWGGEKRGGGEGGKSTCAGYPVGNEKNKKK